MERLRTINVHPLDPGRDWQEPIWIDLTADCLDITPLAWEANLEFWRQLHEVIDTELHLDEYRILYGGLAALGIARGEPFAPDDRMTTILEGAARIGNGQMRAQVFADRRLGHAVWPDRQ